MTKEEVLKTKITRLSPGDFYKEFVDLYDKTKWPPPDKSWTNDMFRNLRSMGKRFGYDVRTEVMRIDLTWHVELPNTNFIELALEYEDSADSPDKIVEEVRNKLVHIKSYLKCVIGYFDKKADQLYDTVKEIEDVISAVKIEDPAQWLLIFIKTLEKGRYNAAELLGFSKDPTQKSFQQIGSKIVNVRRK